MKRILCIVGSMDTGGAETFLMKMYRTFNKSKYQMDFIVSQKKEGYYDKEILSMGGKIYYVPPKSESFFKSFFGIKKVVKENNYKNVMRISAHALGNVDLIAAKLGGAKNLILRSSNANVPNVKKLRITHKMFKFLSITIPNIKLAPSPEAAIFTFGKKQYETGKVKLLNNGLNVDNYLMDDVIRKKYRKMFNVDNKYVIGHVGRFENQKNHEYLIDIFKEFKKINKNAFLILIGEGVLQKKIVRKIERLELNDDVLILNKRSDIPQIMMAMDLYLFPSLYEGMPNTVIEAQASGLPCIVSNTITKKCNITGLVDYMDINDLPEKWAKEILSKSNKNIRINTKKCFIEKKYDIESTVKEFLSFIK